jgi:hypothetical protein
LSFEQQDTFLLGRVSPLSYFKITSYQDLGGSVVRILATPLVLYLTFRFYPFGFKSPLILGPAIVYLEYTSHLAPMGYSYWCSHLKLTIHIARSVFHFPTKLSSVLQAHWYPTCILEFGYPNRKTINTMISLYPPFEVYLTTIYGRLSFIQHRSVVMDNNISKNVSDSSDLFYKDK